MNLFAGKLSVNKKTGFEKLRTGFKAFKILILPKTCK
jgi:hypothetical protein